MSQIRYPASFAEILPHYDGFIIDLWGVVHDGAQAYPNVKRAFTAMQEAGKKVVMLSNAPRRVSRSMANLAQFDIVQGRDYQGMVTSGEVSLQLALDTYAGLPCYFMGDEYDAEILRGTTIERVYDVADAAYVFCVGHYYANQPLYELEEELREMQARRLVMLCANPDIQVITLDGSIWTCAGEIAAFYEQMSGEVVYIGKPYPLVYDHAKALLDLPAEARILAIGDNLDTDIKGAMQQGFDSLFIAGGMHAPHLAPREVIDSAMLERLCAERGVMPTYCTRYLGWYSH